MTAKTSSKSGTSRFCNNFSLAKCILGTLDLNWYQRFAGYKKKKKTERKNHLSCLKLFFYFSYSAIPSAWVTQWKWKPYSVGNLCLWLYTFIVFLISSTDKYLNKKMSPAFSEWINLNVAVCLPSFYCINKTAVNSPSFRFMNIPWLNQ